MKTAYNEQDFTYAVARLRVLETKMLKNSDYEKLLNCATIEECIKTLAELGWQTFENYQTMLDFQTKENYNLIKALGGADFLKIQRVKYDYHNIKVLIKAELTKQDANDLLVDCGNISVDKMKFSIINRDFKILTKNMQNAIDEALLQFSKIPDASLVDIIIDRYSFMDMLEFANENPHEFVLDMIKTYIDIYNIKTFIRVKKMGKPHDFIRRVIADGGYIPPNFYVSNETNIFDKTIYSSAFNNENLELVLDNMFLEKANKPRSKAFGLAPIAGYFFARENEIRNAQIILTCKNSGISADIIRQRLRGI